MCSSVLVNSSIAIVKHHEHKHFVEEKVYLISSSKPQSTIKGSQGRKSMTGTLTQEPEAMGECCLLPCSSWLV